MSRLLNPVFGDKENLDFPFRLVPRLDNRNSQPPCVPALRLRGTCVLPRAQINVNATAHASAATSKLAPARGSPPTWRQP